MSSFNILSQVTREYKRFNASGIHLVVKLNHEQEEDSFLDHFQNSLTDIINDTLRDASDSDMVGVTIFNEINVVDKPIGISFRRKDQLSSEVVGDVLQKVCQSNTNFQATDTLRIEIDWVKLPEGHGRNKKALKSKGRSLDVLAHLKTSIVKIKSLVNCLAYALIVAIAKVTDDTNYKSYRDGKKIKAKVDDLLEKTKIDLSRGGGLPELEQFQNYYYDKYRIVVYSGLNLENVIYDGNNGEKPRLNLLYDAENKHYDTIVSLTGAMSKRFICHGCSKGFDNGASHSCKLVCFYCRGVPPCPTNANRVYCEICNRCFRGQKCFENHREIKMRGKKTVCDTQKMCNACDQFITRNHECYKTFCTNCKENKDPGHFCYMTPLKDRIPSSDRVMYVFYDVESRQDTKIAEDTFLHVPNLLCVEQSCSACETSNEDRCSKCGPRRHSFWNDPIHDFMEYLRQHRPQFDKIVAIAHNARSYDLQFVLDYAVKRNWTPELILNGCKILSMKIHHLHFLDSLNFIALPLRLLPKTFGITSVTKGFYPFLFNTQDNLDYVGPYPNESYFGADTMSEGDRKVFTEWYDSVKHDTFENKKELEKYCQADVSVLRESCILFKNLFRDIAGIEIFLESITIASACNKVYRKKFLEPNTIGLIPKGGYRMADKCSKKALMWLIYEQSNREGDSIQHAGNGREVRLPELPQYKVDGYCSEKREVFEFLGCYYHGCLCMPNRDVNIFGIKETLAERYEATMARIEAIVSHGYTVHVMWECDFEDILKNFPALQNDPIVQNAPLVLRDCLYGGRTEAMRLYHKVREGEEIRYVDVMSLYPWVCKYYKFPIGHPTIYIGEECADTEEMLKKEGVVKCTVLPPRNLYHPVLPYRCSEKLMFCLCRTCAEEGQQESCNHKEEAARVLTGTWVVDEVRVAVEMGYKIVKIYEFYEYQTTEYNKDTKAGGLFVNYINMFLQIKAESSGYPAWVSSEEDKEKYIRSFLESEGILMDRENIVLNPGKRAISKLCLNSFWGKLTERPDRCRTVMINDPQELYSILSSPGIEVSKLIFANDQVVWLTWKYTEEETPSLPHTNLVIGAYVTTGARLRLYTHLKKVDKRALYCDTDSIFYTQQGEEDPIPIGDALGDMTDELVELGQGTYISEFVSGGPKNYAYKVEIPSTSTTKTVCKVRGITLNYSSSKLVNFDTIKRMVLDRESEPFNVRTEKKIKRKAGPSIVSEPEEKMYRICFGKRRRLDNNDSFPFGYK